MFLSALLQSFNSKTQEKSRRKLVVSTAVLIERIEDRLVLSSISVFPGIPAANPASSGTIGESNPLTSIPRLNSLAGAPVTIYLDFDGHTETQDWPTSRSDGQTGPIVTPVFDIDNDLTTFSDEELRMIEEVWYRVAEDFAPFNVNITTVDPQSFRDFESILVSIGGDGAWIGSPGGVAYLGSFSNNAVNTSYVFSDNTGRGGTLHAKGMALTVSHEVGHMLGLNHNSVYDTNGTKTAEYDSGRPDLGPIMGAPYGSLRDTWSNAPGTVTVTALQDDFAIMTSSVNRTFRFRADDFGNTVQTAELLTVTSPSLTTQGIIGQNNDVDMFRFDTDAGPVSFSAEGLNLRTVYNNAALTFGTNLDLELRLYNASGALIASATPNNSLFAGISATVSQGTYFIAVSGTGQYGALGQYTLTGNVIPLPSIPTMVSPTGTISNTRPTFQWSPGANAASYQLEVDNLTTNVNGFYTATSTTTSNVSTRFFAEGNYRARVRSVTAAGAISDWSPYQTFTVDIPTPAVPTIVSPKGQIGNAFPTFQWNAVGFATRYELRVTRTDTNARVIYRTNFGPTSYVHFSPLVDANYSVTVRAGNSLNQFSAWSTPTLFSVKSPIPAAPVFAAPGATTTSTNPRFVWNAVEGAAWYDLRVDNLSTGQINYIRQQRLPRTSTFYDPPYMTQGNYQAYIRAVNGNQLAGPWSAAYQINVDILPPARPVMTGPRGADNSPTITTTNPLFTWSTAARAVKYELRVNNLTTRESAVINQPNLTTNSFLSTANLPQGNYRAWVRGINAANEVGPWSFGFDVTVDEPTPNVPVIVAPQANSLNYVENANPTFVWELNPSAFSYNFTLFNVTLNQTAFTVNGLTTKQYTVPTARRLGEYTYRAQVRALNSSGDASDWSTPFIVQVNVPDATTPILVGPGDTLTDRTPVFSWVHTSTSFRYELLIRDLVRNEDITLQVRSFQISPGGTQASYTLPDSRALAPSTYRFWVRAFNSQGQASQWSTSKSFVIAAQLEQNPLLPTEDESSEVLLLTSSYPPVNVRTEKSDQAVESNQPAPDEVARIQATHAAYIPVRHVPGSVVSTDLALTEDLALIDAVMRHMADPKSDLIPQQNNS
jgi:predicted phage tail protein